MTVKIDNIDIVNYGAKLYGSINDLLRWHPLKDVEVNDWPDENGIEPDLAEPTLDSKQLTLSFVAYNGINSLVNALVNGAYHIFYFEELGITRTLRMLSNPEMIIIDGIEVFSVVFSDDFPLEGYDYVAPNGDSNSYGYSIDDIDLASYGLVPLQGLKEQLNRKSDVKKNLTVSIANVYGVDYDSSNVLFAAKDVTIKLYYTGSLSDFLTNYYALLYNLIQSGTRKLSIGTSANYFYYLSNDVEHFQLNDNGIVKCVFNVNTRFTMQDPKVIYLLTTEDDKYIETEDGNYLIELA